MLEQMFVGNQNLFCFRSSLDACKKLRLHGTSARYSIISAIGLLKARDAGFNSQIDVSKVMDCLSQRYLSTLSYGDTGLMLWADSIGEKAHLEPIWGKIQAFEDYFFRDENACFSIMDIAWVLTGLSYYYAHAKNQKQVSRYSKSLANILKESFVPDTNLFAESSPVKRKNLLAARVQNRISSFASQIYPIAALAVYSRSFGDSTFIDIAERCAETLCRLQGDSGQWPWLYNCRTATIADGYPVYSVHQGGMGPFALFELQQTLKTQRYAQPIFKGLHWLQGHNELTYPVFDADQGIIWRAIQRRDSDNLGSYGIGWSGQCDRYLSAWVDGFSLEGFFNKRLGLEVLMETRPYEYGWYLWAFADDVP
jgi:hypothetical protein